MAMKELQDFPKLPSELIERLMNLTLRYFEERSRVSCIHLSFFLSAFRLMLVSNPTVSSMIYIVAEPMEISMSGRKWSPVTMQGERKPGRSAYMVEFSMHCNVDPMKCKAELCLHVIGRPQDMTYSLLRYNDNYFF